MEIISNFITFGMLKLIIQFKLSKIDYFIWIPLAEIKNTGYVFNKKREVKQMKKRRKLWKDMNLLRIYW